MDRRTALKNMALSFGFAVSGASIINLFNSCSTDKSTLTSEFFTLSEVYSIEMLIDLILPTTSTVGGKDLNVSQFIDKMCQHVLDNQQQKGMRSGAEEFSKRFEKITAKAPTDGNPDNYKQILTIYFDISEAQEQAVFELLASDFTTLSKHLKPDYHLYLFLTTVRELSVLGYFTSQTIMELEA